MKLRLLPFSGTTLYAAMQGTAENEEGREEKGKIR
jgi:hypothetical protein